MSQTVLSAAKNTQFLTYCVVLWSLDLFVYLVIRLNSYFLCLLEENPTLVLNG